MQLFQDSALHLVRGLVGEGHGKDVPVGPSFLVRKQKPYVCLGQIEGLTRTGRRFHYPDHLPQIILK